ncbi:MAG: hypothetical protein KI791_08645 [Cyclobacteriaceae bacterium]|nr:hypothetical protein [Cyclobacteriaceae bacterium SS2]
MRLVTSKPSNENHGIRLRNDDTDDYGNLRVFSEGFGLAYNLAVPALRIDPQNDVYIKNYLKSEKGYLDVKPSNDNYGIRLRNDETDDFGNLRVFTDGFGFAYNSNVPAILITIQNHVQIEDNLIVGGSLEVNSLSVNGEPIGSSGSGSSGLWTLNGNDISYGAGNVSIGNATIPAGYQFSVDGRGIFEEVVVKLSESWPDYVFEDVYVLKPLDELEVFISEHKHLPEIPSAGEIDQDGVSLGAMNALLLKKIEELTLYTINQQKQLDKQAKQIELLLSIKN